MCMEEDAGGSECRHIRNMPFSTKKLKEIVLKKDFLRRDGFRAKGVWGIIGL